MLGVLNGRTGPTNLGQDHDMLSTILLAAFITLFAALALFPLMTAETPEHR